MVYILNRKWTTILFVFIAVLALLSLSQSGITENHLLNPIGLSTSMFSSVGLGISWVFFIMFILLFPLSYSLIGLYSLSTKELDYNLLIAPMLVTPLIFYYLGLSLSALLVSLGFIISVLLAHYISYQDKEHYKKISIYGVTANGTAKGIFAINICIALAVYVSLLSSPLDIDDRFRSDISDAMDELLPMMISVSMMDEQKDIAYAFIDHMETSLLNSMESGMSELSKEERAKCVAVLKDNMVDIDRDAKSGIDKEFERQMNETGSSDILPEPMIEQFSPFYALFVLFSVFITLELLRVFFFVRLSGIYAWLLDKYLCVSKEEKLSGTKPPYRSNPPPMDTLSRQIPDSNPPSNSYYFTEESKNQSN